MTGMTGRQIFGVCLVRNEEWVIGWTLGNVVDFLDHLLVLHNRSSDRTGEILANLERKHPNVRVVDVENASDTHRFVEGWAGENLWVMRVDGDEVYDREGLARLRPRLLAGEHQETWRLRGHTLHVTGGTLDGPLHGYAYPPSKPAAELLNFAAIERWPTGRSRGRERLHGHENIEFRPTFGPGSIADLTTSETWETCDLRALHLCHLPRSSHDGTGRLNPMQASPFKRAQRELRLFGRRALGLPIAASNYKQERYARGPLCERQLSGFGSPADHLDIDPAAEVAAERLENALGLQNVEGSSRMPDRHAPAGSP